ncbi:MAG TPA: hypothetical protein VJZ72_09155 [Candidatus Limnocylindrales bacterium]|nr:hypothetical protein [Candidatus Limnocylindrales bacterium]
MGRLRVAGAVVAVVAMSWLNVVPSAFAFELTTCTIELASNNGVAPLDEAVGPGAGGTFDDPFLVDWDGTVDWTGSTGGTIVKNGLAHVEVFGLPTPLGTFTGHNDEENTTLSGTVGVANNAPFEVTGLFYVSGELRGESGPVCRGSAWLKLTGDPVGTPLFYVALGSLIVGGLLVGRSLPGRNILQGAIGGFVTGLGATALAVAFSVLPLLENTPLALVVGLTVVGFVLGYFDIRPRTSPSGEPPSEPPSETPVQP